jgi:TetR/AcrR family transcriptional regulator, regulator of cefoperazone and chloramphenicol sensitivity
MVKNFELDKDIHDARSRMVSAALRVFAEKGYEGATTREICQAANANISAIRYYFGDKAGLYRAVFKEPLGDACCHPNMDSYANLPLAEAFRSFFREFLDPLKRGEELRLVMKLHFREMIEPTGAWQQEIDAEIKPQHEALVTMLKQHIGIKRVDLDLHRTAFAIMGMAVHFYVGQEVVTTIAPHLLNSSKAIDILADRLADFSVAIIEAETNRRISGVRHEEN